MWLSVGKHERNRKKSDDEPKRNNERSENKQREDAERLEDKQRARKRALQKSSVAQRVARSAPRCSPTEKLSPQTDNKAHALCKKIN